MVHIDYTNYAQSDLHSDFCYTLLLPKCPYFSVA
jgi:hypothetical protein